MVDKKIRGQKRRLNRLLRNIDRIETAFNFEGEYEHCHIPCGWWISMRGTRGKVKTAF